MSGKNQQRLWNLASRTRKQIALLTDVKSGGLWRGELFEAPPVLTTEDAQALTDLLRDLLAFLESVMP